LRGVVTKAEEKDAELELVSIVACRGNNVAIARQYLGGLNISEVRKAQQFKPLVPGECYVLNMGGGMENWVNFGWGRSEELYHFWLGEGVGNFVTPG